MLGHILADRYLLDKLFDLPALRLAHDNLDHSVSMSFDLVEVGMFQGYMEFGWRFLVVHSTPNQYPNIQFALKVAVGFQQGR
jgi:hypothetical protein